VFAPYRIAAVCLLAAAYSSHSAAPSVVIPLVVSESGKIGFTRMLPQQTGLSFTNQLSDERSATNRNLLSGSGVAAGDIDGDGQIDLFFCALDNSNILYRNLGNWRFEDVTASSPAIALPTLDCTGAAFADIDGDGDLDLLVNSLGGGTRLFLNDGRGKFTLRTDSGLATDKGSTSLALADIDGDSDLDLYVTNFRPTTIRDNPSTKFTIAFVGDRRIVTHVDGRPATAPDLTNRFTVAPSGEVLEHGEADILYENDGTGHFTPIPFNSGRFLDSNGAPLREAPMDWGLAAQFRDFTGDGAPDLYVCNDYWTPDRMWINDGKGNFRAAPEGAFRSMSLSSMGVDFADIDRDGDPDCVVVDMLSRNHKSRHVQVAEIPNYAVPPGRFDSTQVSQNTIQLNRGDGTFAQIGEFCGLQSSDWSWAPVFLDVDLDGWEDLLISNGHRRDFQNADASAAVHNALAKKQLSFSSRKEIMEMFPKLATGKAAFRNNHDLTFAEKSSDWGLAADDLSHGFCLADLDNDGDLDLILNNLGTTCGIFRNDADRPRIIVRLAAAAKNTFGIGALITLRTPSLTQSQELISGGRYLSSDSSQRMFALPENEKASLEVRWRSGKITSIDQVKANRRYLIRETDKE
jgi:enediyne biosynthesis protein E4